MCGIAGIINSNLSREQLEAKLLAMQQQLHHRGPDDNGIFISPGTVAGLVATRLAILDLSPAGHQPMATEDNRYHIVFNGEIYNFQTLRNKLEAKGETFKSHSDTEVILKMYVRYGPECVREFEGMFGIAIWDELEQTCFVARGPLGVKPLYYHAANGRLIFGSELRTLLVSELVPRQCSAAAVAGYLLFGAVPEPLTLVADIKALLPGHHLLWVDGKISIQKYWDIQFGYNPDLSSNASEIVRGALVESVDRHLVSDVPVGIFLSGGIDSTAIVALASKKIRENLRTFCISFDDPQFDEGDLAARTARHFGTQHSDWHLDSETAKGLLAKFLACADQPSIDGFNTFCVAKLAHDQGFKVVLSGLGGDELFGGYQSFALVPRIVRASRTLNAVFPVRSATGLITESLAPSPRMKRLGQYLQKMPTTAAAYWTARGIFTPREVERLLPRYCSSYCDSDLEIDTYVPSQPTLEDEVSYLELTRYMRNQLLRDSDVMSMAWSLELRVPFVDRKLVETIERIPAEYRLAKGKQILLDAVTEIPEWVRNHPKRGFTFPFDQWMIDEWREEFRQIEQESPVPLRRWYQTWSLFALENFLARLGTS
jgi:asparagine synthase (glutamine-hydrolysing)